MYNEEADIDPKSLPLFRKGKEIFEVVNHIAALIPDEEPLIFVKDEMLDDAAQLSVKVAVASAAGFYDIKMEAATLIRKAAMSLKIKNHTLKVYGFEETEYYDLVRGLIEEYRLLFIDWVAGFHKWDYVIDRWGLFNPPGISPFDRNPDEDIPEDSDS